MPPPTSVVARPGRLRSAFAGLLAAAVAVGVGEVPPALLARLTSPVEAVAQAFIGVVPGPVERFAIATFGSNDKLVLVVGALTVIALLGAVLGLLARRRRIAAAACFAAFGVAGALAALSVGQAGVLDVVPSVLAAAAGAGALLWLVGRRVAAPADETADATPAPDPSRRGFLARAGILAGLAALGGVGGRLLAGRFTAESSRSAVALPAAARPLAPIPAGVDLGIAGVAPFVTPFPAFYRVDTALTVPQVAAEDWSLTIGGMVDRELRLSYADVLARPLVEADITLTCVSNVVGGGLVGNARWTGIPLAELLDEAGVAAGADQLVGRSVDGYTCGFPVSAAYDREALLVLGMNGEPLPIERGFPARLVVPGLYGYVSATKWLSSLELTTFAAFDQYWVPRGWDERAPIKTSSRIDTPRPLADLRAGQPIDVAGVAWAQTRGIQRVEVRLDDGGWQDAELAEALGDDTWRQWRWRWDDPAPGAHRVTVRATDGAGALQAEERAEPFPNGASGWHQLLLSVGADQA